MGAKFSREVYASGSGDRRDCSVRSFATAACVPYEEAYKIFARHGRKPNRGTFYDTTVAVLEEQFPNHIHETAGCGLTLPKFAAKYNKGHYIVRVAGHMLAVVDGVVHDWRMRPKTKVRNAWRIV